MEVKLNKNNQRKKYKIIDLPEFTWDEIEKTRQNNKLLTLGMELGNLCNFSCIYCYRNSGQPLSNELTLNELIYAAKQAIELGARKIGIVGAGEPTLDPRLLPLLKFLRQCIEKVSIFTNGTGITPKLANELSELQIKIVLKINSLNSEVHNRLVGKKNGYELTMRGLDNLLTVGYPMSSRRIEIESVITKINLIDLLGLWHWCRDNGFTPFFERITPQGRALNSDLDVSPLQLFDLFQKLKKKDEDYYAYTWTIQPPFIGQRCLRHYYNCLIDAQGNVLPCSGVNIVIGNIREKKLSEILSLSPVIHNLRYIDQKIKGYCAECELKPYCYGCRGAAYHLTGDYLAADPLCWRQFQSKKMGGD